MNIVSVAAVAAAASIGMLAAPASVSAQGTFTAQCQAQSTQTQVRTFCERVGQAIDIVEPRLGIALTGGNPVPGTASTLGMRLGSVPRFSIGLRASAALAELPPIEEVNGGDDLTFPVPSLNADASVGVFSGFSVLPTVGGLGSVDVLASAGIIPLPKGEGFSESSPKTWSVGARVGLLRESFTAPGISVSGMYRRLGDLSYGDSTFQSRDAFFALDDYSVWSFRAAISKRIPLIGFGATVGAGLDKYDAAARLAVHDPSLLTNSTLSLSTEHMKTDRKSAFANLSWTLLLVNIVGEVGWQEGGEGLPDASIPTDKLEKAGYFGGVAVRIAL
jgi:hypothetical protein